MPLHECTRRRCRQGFEKLVRFVALTCLAPGCLAYSSVAPDGGSGPEDPPGDDGGAGDGGASNANVLHLTAMLADGAAIPDGRLGVIWYQFDDDYAVEPQIAHDSPFDGAAAATDLPLGDVGVPRDDLLYDYARATWPDDETPRVGVGIVFVAGDPDGNGRIDVAEFDLFETWWTGGNVYGFASVSLGWCAQEHVPSPDLVRWLWLDGIRSGTWPYRIVPRPGEEKYMDSMEMGTIEESYDLHLVTPGEALAPHIRYNMT